MVRKSILDVIRDILKVLSDGKEHSINSISKKVSCHWETALKGLEFLKGIKHIEERKGNKTYKEERLFRLS